MTLALDISTDVDRASPARLALAIVGLLALVVVVFRPAIRGGFVLWDDADMIVQNPDLNPPSLHNLGHYWSGPYLGLYAPLTYSVYMLLALARQPLDAAIFHGASVAIHFASSVVVLLMLRALNTRLLPAWLGAALFAVHPIQVEAVAWAACFNTLLSGFFSLLAIYFYIRHARAERAGLGWFIASAAMLVVAMLSKPSAVVVPLMIVALDLFVVGRGLRKSWIYLLILILLAIPFAVLGRLSQPASIVHPMPLLTRPLIAMDSIAFYLFKLIAPVRLRPDYGLTPQYLLSTVSGYVIWIAPAAIIVIALVLYRRAPWFLGAVAMFILALLPVLGLVTFDFQRYSTVADRYAYLAIVAVSIAAAVLATRLPPFRVPLIVALVPLSILTFVQCGAWHDSVTLARHMLALDSSNLAAHKILAAAAMARHDRADAITEYFQALDNTGDDPETNFNLANALMQESRFPEAIQHYETALERKPNDARIYNNLGIALDRSGQPMQALDAFEKAVALNPASSEYRRNLAILRTRIGT